MGDKSGIQWTDATWNPTTGCDRVSPGCANCYALTMAGRLKKMGQAGYQNDGDPKTSGPGFALTLHPERLDIPLRWKRPRRIFVDSMSDLFHPDVPEEFIHRVWMVMEAAPQHSFQILTKRPERMAAVLRSDHFAVLPNVWLGTSVENARFRTRIDDLRETPAAVRFLSCEPLLGPLALPNDRRADPGDVIDALILAIDAGPDAGPHPAVLDLTDIDWVIIGGESGPGARPMAAGWVREIIAACRAQGAAPYVKQMGAVWAEAHGLGRSHGGDIDTFPSDLQIREWPR